MILALTVGGWGVAMAVAVTMAVVGLLASCVCHHNKNEEGEVPFGICMSAPVVVLTIYGIYCWFGGTQ